MSGQVWVLSFMSFGFATREFEVTADRLGTYRPEEHMFVNITPFLRICTYQGSETTPKTTLTTRMRAHTTPVSALPLCPLSWRSTPTRA